MLVQVMHFTIRNMHKNVGSGNAFHYKEHAYKMLVQVMQFTIRNMHTKCFFR